MIILENAAVSKIHVPVGCELLINNRLQQIHFKKECKMLEKNFKSACAKTTVIVEYKIEPVAYQHAREMEEFIFEKISNARRFLVNEELIVGDEHSRQRSFVDSINYHFETTSDAQNDLEEVGNLIEKFGNAWIKSKGGYSKVCPN